MTVNIITLNISLCSHVICCARSTLSSVFYVQCTLFFKSIIILILNQWKFSGSFHSFRGEALIFSSFASVSLFLFINQSSLIWDNINVLLKE